MGSLGPHVACAEERVRLFESLALSQLFVVPSCHHSFLVVAVLDDRSCKLFHPLLFSIFSSLYFFNTPICEYSPLASLPLSLYHRLVPRCRPTTIPCSFPGSTSSPDPNFFFDSLSFLSQHIKSKQIFLDSLAAWIRSPQTSRFPIPLNQVLRARKLRARSLCSQRPLRRLRRPRRLENELRIPSSRPSHNKKNSLLIVISIPILQHLSMLPHILDERFPNSARICSCRRWERASLEKSN